MKIFPRLAVALAVAITAARAVDTTTVFNEVMYHPPGVADTEWIELRNEMSVNMDLTGWRITGGVNFTFPANTTIPAGGHLVIAANPGALPGVSALGPWTGSLNNGGETIELKNAIGREMDVFNFNDAGGFPVAADGGGVSLAKRASGRSSDDSASWTYSGQIGGTPGTENFPGGNTVGPATSLLGYGATWKFNESGNNLGANWAQTNYTAGVGGWQSGAGVFAFEPDPVALPVGTTLADPGTTIVPHYFQTTFNFSGNPAQAVLELSTLLDDGAVVSLNGHEIARVNMPAGAVDGTARARASVDNATVSAPLSLPTQWLVNGANVLSVDVHAEPVGGGSGSGIVLVQQSGAQTAATNLALTANGGTAIAKDLLGNGSFAPTHTIPNLNNGTYGNPSSWIGNSANSWCGISFGATLKTVASIAFGRDNTNTFTDRTNGTYTLQFTTTLNPTAATPDSAWTTVGTLNYSASGGTLFSFPSRRHRFDFPAMQATGVRLVTPGDGIASGACIDELELYASPLGGGTTGGVAVVPASGFTMSWDGVNGANLGGAVPGNFASAAGATAFGTSELGAGGLHTIAHINDGFYGNSNSWISSGAANQYIGVKFASAVAFSRVAWGRDNLGIYSDRSVGGYTVQFTTVANPGLATAETGNETTGWRTLGTVTYSGDPVFAVGVRHEFNIAPTGGGLITATGVRVKVSDPQICMDELEVAGPKQNDVVFGAQLSVREILPAPGSSALVINEIGGSNDATWRIELRNTGETNIDLGGLILAASNAPVDFTLPAQSLAAGDVLVLDQTQLGFRPLLNDRVFLYNSTRNSLLDAAGVKATVRARNGAEFLTPTSATFGAANTFNLTSDIVINEVMYHFPPNPGAPPLPVTENPEEWIELYNKGAATVNLAGWKLDDAVDFTFPPGTTIEPGAYLVVAKDAAALAGKWPEHSTRILGNFSGSLSNSSDRIELEDATGNPADDVRYNSGGAWPETPDGGGASMELRDVRADNASGGAWAASDQAGSTSWQNVTYTMVAGQTFGQTALWNEFRIGMLDAGECLVDDVSVVRVSNSQQLIQGGDFSSMANKWRMLGNHGTSAIEPEPGNPGNMVLRVRGAGPFSYNHNHIETSFGANTALVDGQSYTVSFRARWLSGSNQLNTRGYYSRLARTTELALPARIGTPGAVNSRAVANLGPTLSALAHSPAIPTDAESVTVTAMASDPDGLGAVTLRYAVNGSVSFASVPMSVSGPLFSAQIPAQAAGAIVQFYVEAADTLAATSALPAAGPNSRALYIVNDGQGSALSAHELRVIMLPAESTNLLAPLNRLSDGRIGGTAIYRRSEVFYDIGVRLQGTAAGRIRDGEAYTGYDVGFRRDHLFRGVHDSVNLDRSGRGPVVRGQDEIYVKHLFHRAGVPCTYDDLVYLITPNSIHTGTAILQMSGYEGSFVASQYGGDGGVFNMDGTYEPSTTTDGNFESLKNPVPLAVQISSDFTNLGTDKEQYRGQLEPRAGKRSDDFTGLIAFCQTMALPNAQLAAQMGAKMDVDEWMRVAAIYSLWGIADCYMNAGFPHNLRVHVPSDGRNVQALPWDMDFVMNFGATSPPTLAGGNLLRVINNVPGARHAYYGHLHELCTTVFTGAYFTPWLQHYGSVVGQSMSGSSGYIEARRNHILSQLPASVTFAITTNGGVDFSVNTSTAALAGSGWIDVREIRRADTGAALDLTWTSDTTWTASIAVNFGPNPITLNAYNNLGALVGTDTIAIESTLPAPTPRDFLRITEVHYNPANPATPAELAISADNDEFEFIELRNTSGQTLNISGCKFVVGVDLTIPPGTTLAAGESIVAVRNVAAFRARYGNGPRIIATAYGPNDSLSNGGETLTLVDATGAEIQSFTYQDAWFPLSDGPGRAIVVRDESASLSAWNGAGQWGASVTIGGTPGSANTGQPGAQFDGWRHTHFTEIELANAGISGALVSSNGVKNLLRYALGYHAPLQPTAALSVISSDGAYLTITYRRTKNTLDATFAIEGTPDLVTWTPLVSPTTLATIDNGDGTETLTLRDTVPISPNSKRHLRVRVTLQP